MTQAEKDTGNMNAPSLIDDLINNVSIVDIMMNTSDGDENVEVDEMDIDSPCPKKTFHLRNDQDIPN
eukprot:scaffold301044_cov39-Attheya_sp.AAC.1